MKRLFSIAYCIALMTSCALTPERPIVTGIQQLPAQLVDRPVSCIKGDVPIPPKDVIDAPTFEQKYYQLWAALNALRGYAVDADEKIQACAKAVTPEAKK